MKIVVKYTNNNFGYSFFCLFDCLYTETCRVNLGKQILMKLLHLFNFRFGTNFQIRNN